jgi:hypothetical protein
MIKKKLPLSDLKILKIYVEETTPVPLDLGFP